MKLGQMAFQVAAVAAVAMAVPSTAHGQLWYNGQFNEVNALSSERNTSISQAMVYDNFVVTGAGWTINSVFGEYLSDVTWASADYEIRTGISVGNGGTLLFSGTGVAATQTATTRSGFGYTEYRATINGLSIFLNPGTYWLGISPVGSGSGRAFASTTSGTGGTNAVIDGVSYFNSTFFSSNFASAADQLGSAGDFAFGVDGLDGRGQEVVPEPATMTLLATGLVGMAAARRRKVARA